MLWQLSRRMACNELVLSGQQPQIALWGEKRPFISNGNNQCLYENTAKKTLCKGLQRFMFYICITSLSFNWYQESKRLHPVFYLYTAQLLTPEIQTVNSTTNIPLQARWWRYTPLIPALQGEGAASGQRQAVICDFEAPLVCKGSSRTGSKATDELCLGDGESLYK